MLASAISAIFYSPVFAQSEPDKTLMPVVVTAARIEQSQTEALPHTTVITKEMIRDRQASDVISLLRSEAGIEIAQSGGSGMLSALYIRGAESRQNLILIDGIPIRDASTPGGTAMALEHLQPDQIERIEIVRGNVSAIYGSGAIGGVIQIFTKRGSGQPAANVSAELGSRGTSKISGGISGQSGDTRYMVSASRFSTDGFSAINTKQFNNENPDKDGDRNVSVSAAISHEWSKGSEFGVRMYGHDAKFSTDGGGFGTPTQIDTSQSKQETVATYSKNRVTSNWLSTVTVSQTHIEREGTTIGGFSPGTWHFKSNTELLQWNNEVMLSPNWMLTSGIEDGREKTNDSTSVISRSNASAYAGLNGKFDAHSVQMNVRNDHVEKSGSATTGYLGYGYGLNSSWKLIASASTGFLAPTLTQLYMPVTWGGNPDLKPERSRSAEAGVQYAAGSTLIRTTFFESRTRDQIQADTSTPFWTLSNISKASNSGLEMSASSRIVDIDVRVSLTLQNPMNDTTGDALLRRAKTLGSLGMSKSFGFWRVGGDVLYVGRRMDTTGELPSYVLANLNVRYKVSKEVSLYGRIENLFNRDYQTVYGYNQPPRGYFAGIEWRQ